MKQAEAEAKVAALQESREQLQRRWSGVADGLAEAQQQAQVARARASCLELGQNEIAMAEQQAELLELRASVAALQNANPGAQMPAAETVDSTAGAVEEAISARELLRQEAEVAALQARQTEQIAKARAAVAELALLEPHLAAREAELQQLQLRASSAQ
jgi:hypothetical protein